MPRSPIARATALASLVLILAIGGMVGWRMLDRDRDGAVAAAQGSSVIGGPFRLTDQFGAVRTDAEFRGRLMLVFFGFTNCPGVCPMEVQSMSRAVQALATQGDRVVPIFISVDPARDTVEQMRAFASNFDPRLVALTGSDAEIAAVAKAYRVYYERPTAAPDEPYDVPHSSMVYLIGTDGRYLTHFDVGTSAEAMAEGIRAHL